MAEPHYILMANRKGGVGKTTLADEVAYSLERMGFSVAFQNLDNQGGCRHESVIRPDGEDFVIVDTPGCPHENFGDWCRYSDLVLVPILPSFGDWDATERTWEIAVGNCGDGSVAYIINRFDPHRNVDRDLERLLVNTERPIYGRVPELTIFNKGHSIGDSIWKIDPFSKGTIAVDSIAERICAHFGVELPEVSEEQDADPAPAIEIDPASPFTAFMGRGAFTAA